MCITHPSWNVTHPNGGKFPSQPPTGNDIGGVTAGIAAAQKKNPNQKKEETPLQNQDQMQIALQATYQISLALSQAWRTSAAAAAADAQMEIFHHQGPASPNPTEAWASLGRAHQLEFFAPSSPPDQYPALCESSLHLSSPN
jgi:hypothetical protein